MATVISNKNFVNTPLDQIPKHGIYRRCNFAQPNPASLNPAVGHRLFPGDDTRRVFVECNLQNVETAPGCSLERSTAWIVETDQPSVVEDDVIEVDGVEVARKVYKDRIAHGKWNGSAYEYFPAPSRSTDES